MYESSLKVKAAPFTIKNSEFDWNTMVPIRILFERKIPFNFHNNVMHPLKEAENGPKFNEGIDPLV